jgi:cytochrome c oxidase cbb3-type subunit 4
MQGNDLQGYITLITFLTFLGICWWAYRSGNRQRFEQDAMLPFLDDPEFQDGDTSLDSTMNSVAPSVGEPLGDSVVEPVGEPVGAPVGKSARGGIDE